MSTKLLREIRDRLKVYKTNDLLVIFGEDFRYMEAAQNYKSMDNMITYMNENFGDQYLFKYSTPSIYVDSVK